MFHTCASLFPLRQVCYQLYACPSLKKVNIYLKYLFYNDCTACSLPQLQLGRREIYTKFVCLLTFPENENSEIQKQFTQCRLKKLHKNLLVISQQNSVAINCNLSLKTFIKLRKLLQKGKSCKKPSRNFQINFHQYIIKSPWRWLTQFKQRYL